jgi:hypothetical protein
MLYNLQRTNQVRYKANAVRINTNKTYKAMFLALLTVMIFTPTYSLLILCVSGAGVLILSAIHYFRYLNSSRVENAQWKTATIKQIQICFPSVYSHYLYEPVPIETQKERRNTY